MLKWYIVYTKTRENSAAYIIQAEDTEDALYQFELWAEKNLIEQPTSVHASAVDTTRQVIRIS